MVIAETIDGNEAAARVAHRLSEVVAIYPITPASPMGELADSWSAAGRTNLWGSVPEVVEMQSEAGAAGALHGAAQRGALATTFTASQGLLLMIPNMYKLAGELSPAVIHVAARSVATHALSIFGDHSDVMAVRPTGWAMLSSSSVQEAHDLALVAHAAALSSRVPFLHFFDGFRTSHEISKIQMLDDEVIAALVDDDAVLDHRGRGLTPDRPVVRGTAQNPDVFMQAREAVNPVYAATPAIVQAKMDELAAHTGRSYRLFDYHGPPDPTDVIVLMGSGAGAAAEAVESLAAAGRKVGMVVVRLYRPFDVEAFAAALPSSTRRLAVLDRTKEPGSVGEPLHTDVVSALAAVGRADIDVIGGRYGLSSKEFTPAMVAGVFAEMTATDPKRRFTVGIVDDVSGTSIVPDAEFRVAREDIQAVFHGLGSDGTVGANKASIKIIGEHTDLHAQAYFQYDSRKAGAQTVSHLRFGPTPIRSTYLIDEADFVACHQFGFLDRVDVLARAGHGATFLLNSPHPAAQVWEHLPREVQQQILDLDIDLWVIDAVALAAELGLGSRINTVMLPCFFALSGVLPTDQALAEVRAFIEETYGKRGPAVVEANLAAVDRAVDRMARVAIADDAVADGRPRRPVVPEDVPDFVERVTARIVAGEGDLLPVSALPLDGTFPTATSKYEQRALADEIPIWDPDICIDCGRCAVVCPHAAIRMKVYQPEVLADAPDGFKTKPFRSRDVDGHALTIQVAPDDCTGCGICVDVCPAKSKEQVRHKSINMAPAAEHRDRERPMYDWFRAIPELDRTLLDHTTVKGSQALQPLFEFSGACAGCGETPYLKLLTQLFGDRIVVANATGCSSIYGGNLPTTPWATNADGRGPAWSNSLFEDNAEFGLGLRLGLEHGRAEARRLVDELRADLGDELADGLLADQGSDEAAIADQRALVVELRRRLADDERVEARRLRAAADDLVRKSVWIVGGDGWAYDIGFGGLDHVLGSGRDVNVLVMDTQVYSNTGGQASKATPRGAVAKFAASGKGTARKDLGSMAMAYGDVYVAQVAMGANDRQTVRAFAEADAWPGPSLIIAYSTCIAHGIDMDRSMTHQADAVRSGFWPLYRYRPAEDEHSHPFQLDSKAPTIPIRDFALQETRWSMAARRDPERSEALLALSQADADERWRWYAQLADVERSVPHAEPPDPAPGPEGEEPGT